VLWIRIRIEVKSRIQIRINVKSQIRIRIKVKSRIQIRISADPEHCRGGLPWSRGGF
jgi:hypothetical protein